MFWLCIVQLLLLILCCFASKSRLNVPSSKGNLGYYDLLEDSDFSSFTKNKQNKNIAVWKGMGKLTTQFLSYGSIAYLGFSLSRKLVHMNRSMLKSCRSHSMLQDEERIRNETVSTAVTELKSELLEIWNAILNIHNKHNEFRENLASIQLNAEERKQEISQVESIDEEVSELKSRLEVLSKALNSLDRKLGTKLQQETNHEKSVEKLTQSIVNMNSSLNVMAMRIEDMENRSKVLEQTLVARMKKFFQVCKDLILNSIGSQADEIDDANLEVE